MPQLRVLVVHNRYKFHGGEDVVAATEVALLRAHGHEVEEYFDSNESLDSASSLKTVSRLFWSTETTRSIGDRIREFRPDIVHCHNTFYRVSPSVYWICHNLGVPVVQTLHNYRLGCASAQFSRNGVPCELCISSPFGGLNAVRFGCFQNSAVKSLALTAATGTHHLIGTYSKLIDAYICLCQFAFRKHVEYGLPADKLVVRPNCVFPDPGPGLGDGDFALLAGRLEADKGVQVVLDAAERMQVPIHIVGQGPLESKVREAAKRLPHVHFMGPRSRPEVLQLMQSARLLIFPSLLYENCPMTIAEAFSTGLPVVASRLGASGEIVEDAITGAHFEASSAADLARVTNELWNNTEALRDMRSAARAQYLAVYSSDAAYRSLMSIYRRVLSGQPPAVASKLLAGSN